MDGVCQSQKGPMPGTGAHFEWQEGNPPMGLSPSPSPAQALPVDVSAHLSADAGNMLSETRGNMRRRCCSDGAVQCVLSDRAALSQAARGSG